jgi:ABC-type multidrug transport system ATPase subunit
VIEARTLSWAHPAAPDLPLQSDLSFTLRPGLTLLRGGEGRGKTTLLQLLAGELAPRSGTLEGRPGRICFPQPSDPAVDAVVARDWLTAQLARQAAPAGESVDTVEGLIEALGLAPHIDKPFYMLSTGSRRKVGLVLAAAAGATLTLLDQPFAALDARSCRVVSDLLAEAAQQPGRCWVVADHDRPHWLDGIELAGLIDLGD